MAFGATRLIYVVFAVAAVPVALVRRQIGRVVQLGIALVLALLAATLLAHLSHQVRPFQAHRVH